MNHKENQKMNQFMNQNENEKLYIPLDKFNEVIREFYLLGIEKTNEAENEWANKQTDTDAMKTLIKFGEGNSLTAVAETLSEEMGKSSIKIKIKNKDNEQNQKSWLDELKEMSGYKPMTLKELADEFVNE